MNNDLKAIQGHLSVALESLESALLIEREAGFTVRGMAQVLQQAKRTTSRAMDDCDLWLRFPPSDVEAESR